MKASLAALAVISIAAGCGLDLPQPLVGDLAEPAFDPGNFNDRSAEIHHLYYPFVPGSTYTYRGETEGGAVEEVEVNVSRATRDVLGVTCLVVVEREFEDGALVEETHDWYAQDLFGNIWYFGEDSTEYETVSSPAPAAPGRPASTGPSPGSCSRRSPSRSTSIGRSTTRAARRTWPGSWR